MDPPSCLSCKLLSKKLTNQRPPLYYAPYNFSEYLKRLSKDCNFKAVNAVSSRDEYIRDTFIAGLLVPHIRQRLLESSTLSLDEAVSQARSLELAKYHSEQYNLDKCLPTINAAASKPITEKNPYLSSPDPTPSAAKPESYPSQENIACSLNQTCYFCGFKKHNRAVCPAKEAICRGCGIKGHYQKVCRKSKTPTSRVKASVHQSNCIASVPSCLSKAVVPVQLNGVDAYALIDTGSSGSFINQSSALRFNIPVIPCNGGEVSMASTTLRSSIKGYCKINLKLQDHTYKNVVFSVLTNLCSDIIIGHDILKRHSSLQVQFGGKESPLNICSVALANVEPVELFRNLSPDCKPIATKSRRHSAIDEQFIESEIQLLLKEGTIEESRSPWRAQVLVVSSDNHKRRMVVDYSQTINRFTELDAFPLPRIDDIVNKVASYKVYSSIDLKSAYHQIPITENDKPYTAFEACGNLYQFTRVPFGVRNGVPAFQRTLTNIITYEKLEGVQVYLDDVTICGNDQAEHDRNLSNFMKAVSKYNLTLNKHKCKFSTAMIHLLGYVICHKSIRPDPDRLQPLRDLPIPTNSNSLHRALGVATSRTTAYNPQGNGQAERRSSNGKTTPSWLMNPGPVLMKRPVRSSKYEPLVEEVLLLEGNPEYSHIRYADGRETTVSSRKLAPVGEVSHHEEDSNSNLRHEEDSNPNLRHEEDSNTNLRHEEDSNTNLQINERSSQVDAGPEPIFQDEERLNQDQIALRRSSRSKHPPLYLKDYVS
ncbi:uncharacterized protein LOC128984427 [Macrosteles quadrilineatus]|uniref:uncharacterized protein LOC128984427 n=1 Tax=Macrosteles quadrilineatus TaxID=74068 RepID=UPI0023E23149|nr:uncharacterized protein LOC128984427 [Macrosteles quadrilineatus]